MARKLKLESESPRDNAWIEKKLSPETKRKLAAFNDLLDACKFMRDHWEENLTDAMARINDAIDKVEGR